MNIVILDGSVINPGDLSWGPIAEHGTLSVYDKTLESDLISKAKQADILLSNKRVISRSHMEQLPKLKLICLLATGYNNIDVAAAKDLGILVCNAVGYGSPAVAQHVFALMMSFTNHVAIHNEDVQQGGWTQTNEWCYWKEPLTELKDKVLGIYGFGKIGSKVADLALAFDMKVIAHHKYPDRDAREDVSFVSLEQMCEQSDFITLHAPLTASNKEVFDKDLFAKMKTSAIIINTGRGGLVNEIDLKYALENKIIRGAGLDVISEEPPTTNHILIGVPNCIITPHLAWAAKQSRKRLIDIVGQNIAAYKVGNPQNIVN